jgi:hypothetical protein
MMLGPGGESATPGPGGLALASGVVARAATANAATTSSLGSFGTGPHMGDAPFVSGSTGIDLTESRLVPERPPLPE